MGDKKESSINTDDKLLAIDEAVTEIQSYLYFRQPISVIRLALDLLQKRHGPEARAQVIVMLDLENLLRGERK